jgi:antitoxin component of RelBE/YafQ-DinJ toxin-antitoxin module
MTNDARIEVRLPAEMRREIFDIAAALGVSAADVVRMKLKSALDIRVPDVRATTENAA